MRSATIASARQHLAGVNLDGSTVVANVFGALGVLIAFIAILVVTFTCFVGQSKSVGKGIGILVGVGVLLTLASTPQTLIDIGTAISGWLGFA